MRGEKREERQRMRGGKREDRETDSMDASVSFSMPAYAALLLYLDVYTIYTIPLNQFCLLKMMNIFGVSLRSWISNMKSISACLLLRTVSYVRLRKEL